jgi:hypothetical protein
MFSLYQRGLKVRELSINSPAKCFQRSRMFVANECLDQDVAMRRAARTYDGRWS